MILADHGAEGAHLEDELAPEFAGLPPAIVAGVVAEAQEERERDAEQREGSDGDFAEQAGVKVMDRGDDGREGGDHQQARQDGGKDRALEDEKQAERAGLGTNNHVGMRYIEPASVRVFAGEGRKMLGLIR